MGRQLGLLVQLCHQAVSKANRPYDWPVRSKHVHSRRTRQARHTWSASWPGGASWIGADTAASLLLTGLLGCW